MAIFLWCLLGIVLAILIIWLIFRWRRRSTGTGTAAHTAPPRPAPGDGGGSSEQPAAAKAAAPDAVAPEITAPEAGHSNHQQLATPTATATLERTTAPAETAPAEKAPDLKVAASALGRKVVLDDLTVVDGIGPKISELIHQAGIHTWRALSTTPVSTLTEILVAAGPRFGMHNPGTWPRQASLLADGQWEQFKQWTAELDGGKERN